MLEPMLPVVADMLRQAREEITAFADFPEAHWRKGWSTNPLERLNREVKSGMSVSPSRSAPITRRSASRLLPCCRRSWPYRVASRGSPLDRLRRENSTRHLLDDQVGNRLMASLDTRAVECADHSRSVIPA
jgi:hypothetical protein